jgi:hypothetical protein
MHEKTEYFEDLEVTLEDHLAEGIAAVMSAEAQLSQPEDLACLALNAWVAYLCAQAPVAQLDRALPSEGRGHRFEFCRVHQ